MQKYCLFLLLCALLLYSSTPTLASYSNQPLNTPHTSSNFVKSKTVFQNVSFLAVRGQLPNINQLENKILQDLLNKKIAAAYNEKLSAALAAKSKSLKISYEVKKSEHYHSILIYFTTQTASAKDEVVSLVFKTDHDQLLGINDIINVNGLKLITQEIAKTVKQNPGKYNTSFSTLSAQQAFYVENGRLVVVFNKYVLGPGTLGLPTFSFNIDTILKHTFVIARKEYYLKEPYNLKMVPLRPVCEALGFTVHWNFVHRTVEITKPDFLASAPIGQNIYHQNTRPSITLESAPEIIDNTTYLPISFFEVILNAVYTAEANGNITFSIYPITTLESAIFIA